VNELRNNNQWSWWFWLGCWILFSVVLGLINAPTIGLAGNELGDYAANSLLIQDAKHFDLFVGNYSRVGFNHPGPAILYVLTLGEVLCYDWLHWVQAPFAGQLVAVFVFNAFWLTLLLRLLALWSQSLLAAILGLALFTLLSVTANHHFFTSIWFPHLYYLPFAVLVLALARFADGKTDTLYSLALSAGFLMNGHVSFIALLGIMLMLMLLFNFMLFRKDLERRILSRVFLRQNHRRLLQAIGLLSLFFIPMLIQTIRAYPGPLLDYLGYDAKHHANTLEQAFNYIRAFWINGWFMGLGVILGGVLCIIAPKKLNTVNISAWFCCILAATFAVLIYAIYGIDELQYQYIAFFYYAATVLFVVMLLITFNEYFTKNYLGALIVVSVSAVFFLLSYPLIQKAPETIHFFNGSKIQETYTKLNQFKKQGRLVFDLERQVYWRRIAGLAAYAKRQNNDLFCIQKNWHILFTKKLLCSAEEIVQNPRFIIVSRETKKGTQSAVQWGQLRFVPLKKPNLIDQGYISVHARKAAFRKILARGWTNPEADFVWSLGAHAEIGLPLQKNFKGELLLDLSAYLPRASSQQELQLFINKQWVKTVRFTLSANRQKISLPLNTSKKRGAILEFVIAKPMKPSVYSHSQDARQLGVALYGLQIKRA